MNSFDFANAIEKYLDSKRHEMKERYNRVLPTGELLFNRFDKSQFLGFGANSSIYDTSIVMGDVEVGENVWIGPYTLLEGINGKLKIGNYVSIDTGVAIYTHDSTKHYVSGGGEDFIRGDVTIGNYTVIGTMSIISCNIKIGEHCVVGAHSFVTRDIPDNSIVAGIPAEIIGNVGISETGQVTFHYF